MKGFGRDFLLLWQGQMVSQLGDQAFLLATMYWAMEATGSASLMGAVMMASTLPAVVLAPVGGTVADWFPRRTILVVSDLLSGVAILALAAGFLLSASVELLVPLLFVAALTTGAIRGFFRPAITASIPDLVPEERVAAANSLTQLSGRASTILGQSLGGILYRVVGAPVLFLADGVSFLLSALSESFIRMPAVERGKHGGARDALAAFRKDTAAGLRYVWESRGMRVLLLVSSMVNFFVMPVFVLLPFYVELRLGEGAAWYGFLLAAISAGSVLGLLVAGGLKVTGERLARILMACFFGASGLMGALAGVTTGWVALLVLLLVGTLSGVINILTLTLFQTRTPAELRGRVMGLVFTLAGGITPLGMLLGGVFGDLTGKNIPLVYAGCGAAAASCAVLGALDRDFREFLAMEPAEA